MQLRTKVGKAVNNVIEETKVKGVAALIQKHAAMAKNGVVAASKKDESNDDADSKCATCILFMLSVSNSAYLRKVQVCTSIQFARVQNLRIKAQCADQNGLKQKYTEVDYSHQRLMQNLSQKLCVNPKCSNRADSFEKVLQILGFQRQVAVKKPNSTEVEDNNNSCQRTRSEFEGLLEGAGLQRFVKKSVVARQRLNICSEVDPEALCKYRSKSISEMMQRQSEMLCGMFRALKYRA
ncbi:hypothetical protein L6452_40694 [Arctium lappa]|uniref:Uncharacterized protein n=1 Tax=Arctium lappa TaxID=4217 RepID=A0ACB8XM29_ARCLA|nr:hypothetical protein L6452_40694 [Arctium lappa]